MALDLWTLEGGLPDQNITIANSGGASGTPIQGLTLGAGTTITYSDISGNGNVGMAVTRASGSAASYVQRQMTAAATRSVSIMVMFPALPGQAIGFIGHRGPGNVQQGFITLNASNKLEIRNALNVAISTATDAITAGVWYRIEQVMTTTGTTTTGSGKWAYYEGNNTTPVYSATYSGVNFGTATAFEFSRVGRMSDTWINTVYFDDYGMDNISEFLGPVNVSTPTLVKSEGAVWRVDLRGSARGNGGTLTYPAPVKVSGPTLAFTEPADGLFIFTQDATTDAVYTFTVAETGGSTSSQDMTVPKALTGSNTRGWYRWSPTLNEWV